MHAGFLRRWRTRLRESNRARTGAAEYLSRRLSLTLAEGPSHPYLRLPIMARTSQERERILSTSRQRGLGLSFGYPTPINEIPEISWLFRGQRFEAARRVADSILTLPTHHWLSDKDKRAIAECVGAPADRACETRPLRNLPRKLTEIFLSISGGLPHDSEIRWWHIRRTVRAAKAAVPSRHVFAMFRWSPRQPREGTRKGAKPC